MKQKTMIVIVALLLLSGSLLATGNALVYCANIANHCNNRCSSGLNCSGGACGPLTNESFFVSCSPMWGPPSGPGAPCAGVAIWRAGKFVGSFGCDCAQVW